jgi:hypothetical protein
VVGGAHHRRHDGEAGPPSGAPPALAGDELVLLIAGGAHEHRLQHADLADRRRQLRERLFVEVHTRLVGVGDDAPDRNVLQSRLIAHHHRRHIGGDECPESFTESALPGHR